MKTYSTSDYFDARMRMDAATIEVELKQKNQRIEREGAEAILRRLDREMAPLCKERDNASDNLHDLKRRLLGPWDVSKHYDGAHILILGGTDKCWDDRVWLRMVMRKGRDPEWQWEVRIHGATWQKTQGRDVVFGPMIGPRKEDFEAQQRKTEKLLVEMGYILYEDSDA